MLYNLFIYTLYIQHCVHPINLNIYMTIFPAGSKEASNSQDMHKLTLPEIEYTSRDHYLRDANKQTYIHTYKQTK